MVRKFLLLFLALFAPTSNDVDADRIVEGATLKQRTMFDVTSFDGFNSSSYATYHEESSAGRKSSNSKSKVTSSIKSTKSGQSTKKTSKKSSKKGGKRGKISGDIPLEPTESRPGDAGCDTSRPIAFPSFIVMTLPPEVNPTIPPAIIPSPPPAIDPISGTPVVIDPTTNSLVPTPIPIFSPSPSPSPDVHPEESQCRIPTDKCCQNSDCASNMICAGRNCVSDGILRITLTWFGQGKFLPSIRITSFWVRVLF